MNDAHPLDNAVHASLTTYQADIAETFGTASRYPADINVFHAVDRCDETGWADLAALVGPRGTAVLFRDEVPEPPPGWKVSMRGPGRQMLLDDLVETPPADIRELTADDVPAMLELTDATKPGPFAARTHELGHYAGVFDGDRLVAMAGERIHVPGYREISAVCTDSAARGRGLAATMTMYIARRIAAAGEQPFLHVAGNNDTAYRVYERLGFVQRRLVEFTLLRAPD